MNGVKVSIIIPIYNVESYIERCAKSLFEQSFIDVEFIFVDDCSQDNSINRLEAIIKQYPYRNVRLVKHSQNRGLLQTRLTGIKNAVGDFILNIDSDDCVMSNMVELLYYAVVNNSAKIAYCDYQEWHLNRIVPKYQPLHYSNAEELLFGILFGECHASIWTKMISRDLFYLTLDYPDICLYEDKCFLFSICISNLSAKVVHVQGTLLNYNRTNVISISKTKINQRKINDNLASIEFMDRLLRQFHASKELKEAFYTTVLYHKKMFLLDKKYSYLWSEVFPQVNQVKYILKYKGFGIVAKVLMILALFRMPSLLRIASKFNQ